MAASLLCDEPIELVGVPHLTEVQTMAELLRRLGKSVEFEADTISIQLLDIASIRADRRLLRPLLRRMRAGFCVLGPLLARRGRAEVPMPGGCDIGDRPVDLHLRGLAALGRRDQRTTRLCGGDGPSFARETKNRSYRSAWTDFGHRHGQCAFRCRACSSHNGHLRRRTRARGRRSRPVPQFARRADRGPRHVGAANRWCRSPIGRALPRDIRSHRSSHAAHGRSDNGRVGARGRYQSSASRCRPFTFAQRQGATIDVGPHWVRCTVDERLQPTDIIAEPYPGIPTDLQRRSGRRR